MYLSKFKKKKKEKEKKKNKKKKKKGQVFTAEFDYIYFCS